MNVLDAAAFGAPLMLFVGVALWRWFFKPESFDLRGTVCALVCIGASTALTQHALAAERAHVVLVPYKSMPRLDWLYLAFHFGLTIWVLFRDLLPPVFQVSAVWPAAFGFSSYLYFRTFFVAEQGAPYLGLYALVLGYALLEPRLLLRSDLQTRFPGRRGRPEGRSLRLSLLVLLLVLGISTAFSLSRGESLGVYLQIVCLATVPYLLAGDIDGEQSWRLVAIWAVLLGGVTLVGLAGLKFVILARDLDWVQAVRHRLFIAEIGPNWISRPLVILIPPALGLALTAPNRSRKLLWAAGIVGMLLTLAYSQSNLGFGGWLALWASVGALILLLRWPALARWWKGLARGRLPLAASLCVALLLLVGLGVWLAVSMNAYSFNGRLYIWRTALQQAAERPWVGSGLGVRYRTSEASAQVNWDDMGPRTQWFLDHPLARWWQRRQTRIHTHNLLLELAAGSGAPAALAFLWYLWSLARYGLRAFSRAEGRSRVLVAGVTAGLAGALGWGILDVLEYSPPFFSFPTWALIGLLLAAPRVLDRQPAAGKERVPSATERSPRQGSALTRALCVGLLLLPTALIVVSLLGNGHYRRAYVAYQQDRWEAAVVELEQAARWGPLNAKYRQLLGETEINLGRYAKAITAYQAAARLKRGYAPYHAQLGWLYWQQGDLERATVYLERAVEMDPREAWRDGLHAELGLAYVAQGRSEEAILLFKETIVLDPQTALAPYWVPVQDSNGAFDVVLDGAYLPGKTQGKAGSALRRRTLVHLGKAGYTSRLLAPNVDAENGLSIGRVLDAIHADYEAAHALEDRRARRLLAAEVEAAQLVGLHERAEVLYAEFQAAFPGSAFGFRDLGLLYREQGALEEAYELLERATEVSPRDVDSRIGLAKVALDRGQTDAAWQALDVVYRLAPRTPGLYVLRSQLAGQEGDWAQAGEMLHRSLLIEESVPDRVSLARIYHRLGEVDRARAQCIAAAELLLRTWPDPLDPALWEIGACLAETGETARAPELDELVRDYPLAGTVLQAHIARARGEWEHALGCYAAAAEGYPDEGALHYMMGETYEAMGQVDRAERAYLNALLRDAQESLPLLALGRMQDQTGRHLAAQESYRAATEVTPGWGQVHVALANALFQAGDRKGAADHYQLALIVERDLDDGVVYDFAAHLADAEVFTSGLGHVRQDVLDVRGEQRRALFAHPTSQVRYRVQVPQDAVLAFDVATAPESWAQPGDGVSFAVHVASADGGASSRQPGDEPVWSVYLDPKHDPGARGWQRYHLDLGSSGGKDVYLTFETSPGPAGDERFDWAAWGEPRIVRR